MAETNRRGANPAQDPETAAGGEKPTAAKVAQGQAAEQASTETSRDGQQFGDATVVSFDDADGLESLGSAAGGEEFVVIDKDIVREFYFPKTRVPSYELLYHAGQLVPKSLLAQRAAAVRASQADRTKLVNYIDPSTYASGTGANADPAV